MGSTRYTPMSASRYQGVTPTVLGASSTARISLTLWQGSMGEPATREEVNLPQISRGNQDFRE